MLPNKQTNKNAPPPVSLAVPIALAVFIAMEQDQITHNGKRLMSMCGGAQREAEGIKKKEEEKEDVEEAGYMRIVDEGLLKLMGGVKLCLEEELTRAVLLEFLKSQSKR